MAVKKFREQFWPQRKHPAWEKAAKQINGQYEKDSTFFSTLERSQIVKQVFDWPLTLFENYNGNHSETKLVAPFLNPNNLDLHLCRDVIFRFPRLRRSTTSEDVGHPEFTKHYSIRKGDATFVHALLSDPKTLLNILKQPFSFQIKIKSGDSLFSGPNVVHQLELIHQRPIRNPNHIESLFSMAEQILLLLHHWPSICDRPSGQRTLPKEPVRISQALQETLNETLQFFATRAERLNDSFEAHFEDPEGIVAGRAKLRVDIPTLPDNRTQIIFEAPHPAVHNPLSLSRNVSWVNKLNEIIKDSSGLGGFHMESTDDHSQLLEPIKPNLTALQGCQAELHWTDDRCVFRIHNAPGEDASKLVYNLLEIWRTSVRVHLGFAQLTESITEST